MSPQAGWILHDQIVPRLRASIPRNVNFIGSEDAEELIQDATVMAAKLLDRTEQQGKTVTAGNIAYYTILHMKSGRRSCGSSNSDALGTGTQLNGRSSINSLEETVAEDESGNEIFQVHDVLSIDHEDPAVKAARRLDWDEFLCSLTDREQLLVECMMDGQNHTQAAKSIGISTWTVRQCKMGLALKVLEFMGPDILATIAKLPGWKNNLHAQRELLACKHDRRH